MSLLLDPPMLVGAGAAIQRLAPDDEAARRLESATLAVFLGASIPLYCNAPWMRWFARLMRAETGREFMLNSWVFDFEHRKPPLRTHLVSAAILATYPLWLRLGRRLAERSS